MNKSTRRLAVVSSLLMTLAAMGCGRAPEGWTPVLEETSTAFLTTQTEAVAARVRKAKADLTSNLEGAEVELTAAEDGLDHLLTYYLPLLEARERAYNAYRHHLLGHREQTVQQLDAIEPILMRIAETGHGHLLREMEEPLEKLEDARAALATDTDEAAKSLQTLAIRLNFLLIKGGLVLTG